MPELWGLLALSLGMTLVPGIDTAMVLRVPRRQRRVQERIMGTVLVALGLKVALNE